MNVFKVIYYVCVWLNGMAMGTLGMIEEEKGDGVA